jgi:hypothetical protein
MCFFNLIPYPSFQLGHPLIECLEYVYKVKIPGVQSPDAISSAHSSAQVEDDADESVQNMVGGRVASLLEAYNSQRTAKRKMEGTHALRRGVADEPSPVEMSVGRLGLARLVGLFFCLFFVCFAVVMVMLLDISHEFFFFLFSFFKKKQTILTRER